MKYLYLEFSKVHWLLQISFVYLSLAGESSNTGYHGISSCKLARNYV